MYDPYEQNEHTPEFTSDQQPQSAFEPSQAGAPFDMPPAAPKKKAHRKGLTAGKVVALALCCSLVGGLAGAGGMYLGSRSSKSSSVPEAPETTSHMLESSRQTSALDVSYVNSGEQMTAAEVYAQNVNSTVGITTSITTNYFGYQTETPASGSGFIFTDDGYILTNYHVVENSSSIKVTTYDGTEYDATLVGYDESNDVAVLKIDATGLTPVVLGDSDQLNVGDSVIAIGNPLGELTFSLTSGAVSALDREVTFSTGTTMRLIQTDCAINAGNSGGALFNLYGEVIGITNAKYSGSGSGSSASIDNIGFAIPINQVRSIVESIIENGYIAKPYIGVSVTDVSSETQRYGLPQGAAVKSVTEDSPAAQAGLLENDIITKVNDTEITGSSDLVGIVSGCKSGDTLTLTVYRQGETLELTLTVGEHIQSALANEDTQQSEQGQSISGDFPFGFGN